MESKIVRQWTAGEIGKYLTAKCTKVLTTGLSQLSTLSMLAGKIEDATARDSVLQKIERKRTEILSQYGEIHYEDGSCLVRHPSIGFIVREKHLCEAPTQLFCAKTKSLSFVKLKLHRADALINSHGVISYVNKKLVMEMDMTHEQFGSFVTSPNSGLIPATIRTLHGEAVELVPDAMQKQGQQLFKRTLEICEAFDKWGTNLVNLAQEKAEKGGVLSAKGKQELENPIRTLESWVGSNCAYYSETLAEYSDEVTRAMKQEIVSADRMKG